MRRRSSAGASAGGGEAWLPTPVGARSTAPRLHCLRGEFQIWASVGKRARRGNELGLRAEQRPPSAPCGEFQIWAS